jgi:hypothetical protein
MNRYFVKFVVFTITILTANLLGDYASDFLTSFKYQYKPLTFTLLAMSVITAIFYPLFEFLDKSINKLSKRAVKESRSFAGRYFGLIMLFIISMTILTFFYVKQWYGINIINFLFKGNFFNLV